MTAEDYITSVGNRQTALELESQYLSIGRKFLPPCALVVLDGGEATSEYWEWLISQQAKAARDTHL